MNKESLPIKIVPVATIRENDGLAMSSRNALLTIEEREKAIILPEALNNSKKHFQFHDPKTVKNLIIESFNKQDQVQLEYFEIVDEESLKPINHKSSDNKAVACIAAKIGKVRLIDNMILNP